MLRPKCRCQSAVLTAAHRRRPRRGASSSSPNRTMWGYRPSVRPRSPPRRDPFGAGLVLAGSAAAEPVPATAMPAPPAAARTAHAQTFRPAAIAVMLDGLVICTGMMRRWGQPPSVPRSSGAGHGGAGSRPMRSEVVVPLRFGKVQRHCARFQEIAGKANNVSPCQSATLDAAAPVCHLMSNQAQQIPRQA